MATTAVTITINTPTGVTVAQVVQTLSDYWGYQTTVDGQPNPETRGAFVKRMIARFVKQSYVAAKAQQDSEAARQTAITVADAVTVD